MSLQERMDQATAKFAAGEMSEALSLFDEVLLEATEASHAGIHHNRALCLNALGRNDAAIEAFGSCLALDEARPTSWHNLGVLLLGTGDAAAAAEAIDKAIETAASAEDADQLMQSRAARASLHKQAGEIEAAIGLFDTAIEEATATGLKPATTTFCQLAECLCRQGDWETARVVYGSCLDEHGELSSDGDSANFGLALFNLARAAQQGGDSEAAEALYKESLGQARKTHALHNLAVLLMGSGRAAEAEPLLREVVEQDSGHMLALAALGTWLAQEDRFEDAVPFLERAAEASGTAGEAETEAELRRVLGVSCFKLKRFEEAKAAFSRVLEIDPDNTNAANGVKLAQDGMDRGDGVARPPTPEAAPAAAPSRVAGMAARAGGKPASSGGPKASQRKPWTKPAAAAPAAAAASASSAGAKAAPKAAAGDTAIDSASDGHGGLCVPYDELTSPPFADGVDSKIREAYLTLGEFESVFGMSKADFYGKPKWKRVQLKKKHKLF